MKDKLALLALVVASVATAQSIEERRAALNRAKSEAQLATARAERISAAALNATEKSAIARGQAASLAARLQASEADIAAAEERIGIIDIERERQLSRLAEKQQPTARLMAGLVTMARRPAALSLFKPGSTRDLVHMRLLLTAAMPVIEARTAGVRRDIDKSRALRADANAALADLKAARGRLEQQRVQLAAAEANFRREADALAGNAVAEQDRALAYSERARDLSELLSRVDDDAAVTARLATLPGPVMRPMRPEDAVATPEAPQQPTARAPYRLPVIGQIVQGTGEVSSTGVRARGVTIETRPLTLVVAPTSGRIAFAGPFRAYSNIVIVDHGGGWTTLITGLGILSVRTGDTVDPGSPLGRTVAQHSQVTVELRRNGTVVDIASLIG